MYGHLSSHLISSHIFETFRLCSSGTPFFSYHIPLHDVAVKLHSLSVDFWLFVLLPCKPFYVESLKFSQPWDLYSLRKEL